jgi:hypothetical protein
MLLTVPQSEIDAIVTGDYADYDPLKKYGLVTCGYVRLHSDDGAGCSYSDRMMAIKVHWASATACLVHKVYAEGQKRAVFDFVQLKRGDLVAFNGYLLHGLLPRWVAESLKGKFNVTSHYNTFNRNFISDNKLNTKPQLIYEFANFRENRN